MNESITKNNSVIFDSGDVIRAVDFEAAIAVFEVVVVVVDLLVVVVVFDADPFPD